MTQYIILCFCTLIFAAALYFILISITPKSAVHIRIIIDADDEDETEKAVITAKLEAEKHFKNADIFVCGGNDEYIKLLCKRYGTEKWKFKSF